MEYKIFSTVNLIEEKKIGWWVFIFFLFIVFYYYIMQCYTQKRCEACMDLAMEWYRNCVPCMQIFCKYRFPSNSDNLSNHISALNENTPLVISIITNFQKNEEKQNKSNSQMKSLVIEESF